jgi:hypothetical protein
MISPTINDLNRLDDYEAQTINRLDDYEAQTINRHANNRDFDYNRLP